MTERIVSTAAESLATWAASVDPAALAPPVVHAAKRCVLDAVACALAGAHMPWVERVLAVARAQESPGRASVLGRADRMSAPLAALVNGTAVHALDYIQPVQIDGRRMDGTEDPAGDGGHGIAVTANIRREEDDVRRRPHDRGESQCQRHDRQGAVRKAARRHGVGAQIG